MSHEDIFEQLDFILSIPYELTEYILRKLNFCDLISATKVCSRWRKIGVRILKRERKINYAMIYPPNFPTPKTRHQKKNGESLENFLDRVHVAPSTCLGFTNGDWLMRNDIKNNNETSTLYSALKQTLQASRISLVSADGVIGTVQKSAEESYLQNEKDKSSGCSTNNAFDCLINRDVGNSIEVERDMKLKGLCLVTIPDQPGLKISVIRLDETDFLNKYPNNLGIPYGQDIITSEEFNSMSNLESSETIKALMIFYCRPWDTPFIKAFRTAALNRQRNLFAMGGGLIGGLHYLQDNDSQIHEDATAIVFSGNNVTAASVIIPLYNSTIEELQVHLSKFKKFLKPNAQSMCFMFASQYKGRGFNSHRYGDAFNPIHVEIRTFNNMFPRVPLFGYIGSKEFGVDYVPIGPNPNRPNRKGKFNYYATTIFVMVSIL